MRLLVTGGAGFIGSHYVRTVLATPGATAVTVLDKLTYSGNLANLAPVADDSRLTFVRGDVCDAALVDDLMPGHDAVVHFAAESHVDRSIADSLEFTTTNVVGTHVLLDAALRHQVGRFLHVSTDEVYGSVPEGASTEEDLLRPSSPYAASKAASDLIALSYATTHQLPVVVTRCSNNYGPYQHPEKLIPLFITRLLRGQPVPLYGDGHNVRDWLHVDDHCRALALALQRGTPGQVYNIGGGTQLSNRQLTQLLLDFVGAGWELVTPVADRKAHDHRYCVDDTKARTQLGYQPLIPFADGLAHTLQWYREQSAWVRQVALD